MNKREGIQMTSLATTCSSRKNGTAVIRIKILLGKSTSLQVPAYHRAIGDHIRVHILHVLCITSCVGHLFRKASLSAVAHNDE